ncbi:MAG: PEP-CTERM sorting domain-containing protein, partial [Myxococcales bacterium]|nr:PEP-CTERM sorting domain-containing protein [Myxococcales bacterium]
MAKRRSQNQSSRPMRHGAVVTVLLLLPFFAIAGALAPGIITVQYQAEEEEALPPRERVPYRPVRLSRKPLLVPRDYSAGFIPEVLDLEQLFMGTQYRAEVGSRLTRLPSFPTSRGDVIVLDDVDEFIADTLFKDVLQPGVVADATAVWDPALFDIIPNLTGPDSGNQFDDFTGQGDLGGVPPIIPEPATGSLLGIGLLVLAHRRRR